MASPDCKWGKPCGNACIARNETCHISSSSGDNMKLLVVTTIAAAIIFTIVLASDKRDDSHLWKDIPERGPTLKEKGVLQKQNKSDCLHSCFVSSMNSRLQYRQCIQTMCL